MFPRQRQPTLDGRDPRLECYQCFKPQVACICASIERVANHTGIIILQHPRERFHAIGTVRIARLALENLRVEACSPWEDSSAIRAQLPEGTALLYPTAGARELATLRVEEQPRHLVILDGTWFHAKKIYDAHQWLHDLPHVGLTPSEPSRYRIRPEPRASYVATLEAIVYALRIIEPQTRGLDGLLRSFSAMVDWQAEYTPGAVPLPA
jgi:DTW domain-containing protein YfiP